MKLITWNVNGIRAAIRKGLLDYVRQAEPDVLCLQEIKAKPEQVAPLELPHYALLWNSAQRPGYSGTAVLTRHTPLQMRLGLDLDEGEGRVMSLDFGPFWLVNVYTPNAKHGLSRLPYRIRWDKAFLKHLQNLEKEKPVIFCGDLNVAHREIDLANPKTNTKNPGFTSQERAGFDAFIEAGYRDAFRMFVSEGGHYTWWSQRAGVRERNIGWRIDYFGVSSQFKAEIKNCYLQPQVLGSDHCPVVLEL